MCHDGQGLVVLRECADFGGSRLGEVALESKHFKAGALSVGELLLLGLQSGFRVLFGIISATIPIAGRIKT